MGAQTIRTFVRIYISILSIDPPPPLKYSWISRWLWDGTQYLLRVLVSEYHFSVQNVAAAAIRTKAHVPFATGPTGWVSWSTNVTDQFCDIDNYPPAQMSLLWRDR